MNLKTSFVSYVFIAILGIISCISLEKYNGKQLKL